MIKRFCSTPGIYWITAAISGLVSLYKTAANDIINTDGILYIDVAKAFANDGLMAAFEVFPWPLYGVLIALMHMLTGLSYEVSAYTLNAVLLMLMCVTFVRVYAEISPAQSRICVAAVLILALPVLNDYRDMVIRGYGFWACMMLALLYFIKFSKSPGFGDAVKWQVFIFVAILFRVEGIVFLVFAPLYFLFRFDGLKQAVRNLFQLYSVFLFLFLAVVVIMLAVYGVPELNETSALMLWASYASPMVMIQAFELEAGFLYERLQYLSSSDEAMLILAAGLLVLVAVKVAVSAELLFLGVWGYGAVRKWLKLEKESYIVMLFAAIGLLTLLSLAGNRFFLSTRYTILTALFLSLLSFQYIDYMFSELARQGKRVLWLLAAAVVLVLFLDGVVSLGASKGNIKEAGQWLKNEAGLAGKVACNEARLAFYADGRCELVLLEENSAAEITGLAHEYDHLLLWVGRKDVQFKSVLETNSALLPGRDFRNRKGDNVRVYRVEGQGRHGTS